MKPFTGSAVALITPMQDEQINYELYKALLEWHIEERTQAFIITGTTGESATLGKDEKLELYRIAVETVRGRVPVIANTGTNNTTESVLMSREAEKLGVDGLLAVTPYYNKPDQNGLYEHFRSIAAAVNIPVVLYNVPGRTAVNLEAKTVLKLAEIDNIVGIKEASGDLDQVRTIIENTSDAFAVYSGNDDLYADMLKAGGDGVISVVANVDPKTTQHLYEVYQTSEDEAFALQKKLDILNDVLFISPNPVPAKHALSFLGVPVGPTRLPLTPMPKANAETLEKALSTYGVKGISL